MVGEKFGRAYTLSVQTQSKQTLTYQLPFTVEFDITRNVFSSANVASIRVFNLNVNSRNQILKNVTDYDDVRTLTLQAGYGINTPTIFSGNISQAWSVREGVNFITQMESFDAGFAFVNGTINQQFPAGTPQATITKNIAAAFPGVSLGTLSKTVGTNGTIPRGNSYSGNTADILRDQVGGAFFIDNGKIHILADNECLSGSVSLINAENGLLGTPVREQTIINFDMVFEPRLIVGQILELQSSTAQNFNGQYKVISLKHRGMISAAICGDAITSVGLFQGLGGQTLNVVGPG